MEKWETLSPLKRPLREIPYYPAQLRKRYGRAPSPSQGEGRGEGGWVNRLYWGDNLQVMAHLMREFHPRITDTPARRDELVRGEYTWEVGEYGEGQIAVKIVDVLDEEWFGVPWNWNRFWMTSSLVKWTSFRCPPSSRHGKFSTANVVPKCQPSWLRAM